jgi:glycosyltransferase involved in cell wall biosynthesis
MVGYKAARAIAEHVEVVVATHIRNRESIEKVGFGRASVRYIDNEYVARPAFKFAKWLRRGTEAAWTAAIALKYPSCVAFEWEVWKVTRDELRKGKFDLVHRLTPMSPTLPSPMAMWSPVPFVLGPLNGGLKWPSAFREERAREREWLSYVRSVYRLLPYHSSTYRRSAAVLAAFKHTIDDLPKHLQTKVLEFPEVGVDPEVFDQIVERPAHKRKTILFAGRFVPYKLPQLLVRAFAEHSALQRHRLVMVGDGPERSAIERLIHNTGLENQVELLGWKSQTEIAALMREADIFAFPSIRELGAGVVLEAMACGLACVVVDYGGPGTLIDKDRGIKVALGNADQLTQRFGQTLGRLVDDDDTIARLGAAAHKYAMQFYTWDAKARKMVAVYEWVLGRGPRPNFWTAPEPR